MNTKLTKIKETEILSAVPESGHVMAEVDGVVKRVPGNKVGGVPDGGEPYKQLVTDASGKTVWEDRLAWKEERTYIANEYSSGRIYMVKVSDETPDKPTADNPYTITVGDQKLALDILMKDEAGGYSLADDLVCVVLEKEWTINWPSGLSFTFPEKGVYFFNQIGSDYVSHAEWGGFSADWDGTFETIKPIDPEFLGGWKALGEGETVKTAIVEDANVTFNAVENFGLAQDPFSVSLEVGKEYSVKWGTEEYTCTAKVIQGMPDGYAYIGNAGIPTNGEENTGEPFCLYVVGDSVNVFNENTDAITVSVYELNPEIIPIPEKYIPSPFEKLITDEEYGVIAQWDGETTGRDNFSYNGYNYFKVSDAPIPDNYDVSKMRDTRESSGDELKTLYIDTRDKYGKCMKYGIAISCNEAGTHTLYNIAGQDVGTVEVPSPGLYFWKFPNGNNWQTGLYIITGAKCITGIVLSSGVANHKKWLLTVDDSGTLSATEMN